MLINLLITVSLPNRFVAVELFAKNETQKPVEFRRRAYHGYCQLRETSYLTDIQREVVGQRSSRLAEKCVGRLGLCPLQMGHR